MNYDGFLDFVEEGLAKEIAQKDGIEIIDPEMFVTAVTIIEPPVVQQSSDACKIEVVIKITKEV